MSTMKIPSTMRRITGTNREQVGGLKGPCGRSLAVRVASWGRGALLLVACGVACSRQRDAEVRDAPPPTRSEVWTAIQPFAARYRIEPAFIYALVAAESNFNPRARNGEARGLLQLKPGAWRVVSAQPYEPAVWNWRANLEAGIDYLAYSRAYLHKNNAFSYPRLLAAFHYGLDYLEDRKFDLGDVAVPNNEIYRQLWSGNLAPVAPPVIKSDSLPALEK